MFVLVPLLHINRSLTKCKQTRVRVQLEPIQRLYISFMSALLKKMIWSGGFFCLKGEVYAFTVSNNIMNGGTSAEESYVYFCACKMLTVHFWLL